jgi:hypothetical protein
VRAIINANKDEEEVCHDEHYRYNQQEMKKLFISKKGPGGL